MDEALDLLVATGFRKPVCSLVKSDSPSVVSTLIEYHLQYKVKSELDQYIDGLNTFQLLAKIKSNSELWKPFFVYKCNDLTPVK